MSDSVVQDFDVSFHKQREYTFLIGAVSGTQLHHMVFGHNIMLTSIERLLADCIGGQPVMTALRCHPI